ncbi:MAG: transglutaminase domain-containing protein, partial [Solirubrobacteraceae bacterium]|nr:transglutaminase domain-containing protein [Patulibacter sp.]
MSAGSVQARLARGNWLQVTSSRVRPREPRWTRAAGMVVFAGMAIAAWWPVLGKTLFAVAPAVAMGGILVAGRARPRTGLVALVLWIPVALLLAGLPTGVFRPGELASTARALGAGWHTLGVSHRSTTAEDPWAVAAALAAFGSTWIMAGVVATQRGRVAAGLSYVMAGVPFVAAAILGNATDTAWHGAALLAATVLWSTRGRPLLAMAGVALIATAALGAAVTVGPTDRWLSFGGDQRSAFDELDTQQSYGPLQNRRTGATMLEVTAAQPALWRMQVFDRFDGSGFGVSRFGSNDLPEPKARSVKTSVKVVGLKNRLIVSAGQVTSVKAPQSHRPISGEATELFPDAPKKGDVYAVQSEVVDATEAQLAKVPVPSDPKYERWVRFFAPPLLPIARDDGSGGGRFLRINPTTGETIDGSGYAGYGEADDYGGTPLGTVLSLSRQLAKGTTSELEVVRRVEAYLDDPDRFTYTTDVGPASSQPIVDFLLTTHRGYCQHFAGAAALLLRLAGVPTRVVAGFATGELEGTDTYKVTDEDAHAWIEVYFPGYGWVPFNPTPAAAEAVVPASLDLFAAPSGKGSVAAGAALPGGGLVLLAALGGGWWLLRRRRRFGSAAAQPAAAAQL